MFLRGLDSEAGGGGGAQRQVVAPDVPAETSNSRYDTSWMAPRRWRAVRRGRARLECRAGSE